MYINSGVTAGLAMYDTMQYVNPDIATVSIGLSQVQDLLMAGTVRKRISHLMQL